jgi:hypothetical protein
MFFTSPLRWLRGAAPAAGRRHPRRFLPSLDRLEDRTVPSFTLAGSYDTGGAVPFGTVVGDFNNDGNLDLAVVNSNFNTGRNGSVSVLLGNGDGTFSLASTFPTTAPNTRVLVTADFNGDGNLDLAAVNWDYSVNVFLGNGDGTFQSPRTLGTGMTPHSLVAADFNGDGIPDLVVASYDNWGLWLGNGDGTFQTPVNSDEIEGPSWVAVGDFNGDGLPDVVVTSGEHATLNVLLNQPDNMGGRSAVGVSAGARGAAEQIPIPLTALTPPPSGFSADLSRPGEALVPNLVGDLAPPPVQPTGGPTSPLLTGGPLRQDAPAGALGGNAFKGTASDLLHGTGAGTADGDGAPFTLVGEKAALPSWT